jgi:tetratricopeptide (TPR) repeat protein
MSSERSELRARILRAFEQHHYRRGARIARQGQQICAREADEAGEIHFLWMEGALQIVEGSYQEAFATFSATLARIETSRSLDLRDPSVADIAARTYGDWANCAALLPEGPPEGIDEMLARQEFFISRRGLREMTSEMHHSRSICLARLGNHAAALGFAEEGLSLRRANPAWPGCHLDHHLQIYAERLIDVRRWDDAAAAIDEGIERFGHSVYWELRGRMRIERGEFDSAIGALREAVARENASDQLRLLGIAFLLAGDRDAALDQFRAAHFGRPRDVENSLWLAAVSGDGEILKGSLRAKGFEAHLLAYCRGRMPAGLLLEKAHDASTEFARRVRLSSAHGFIALRFETAGDIDAAREHYRRCRESAVPGSQLCILACGRLDAGVLVR